MKNLNDKIKKLFSTYDGPLNSKITKCELQKTDDGTEYFEGPVVTLSSGGATVVVNGKAESVSLDAPAKAEFAIKKVHPYKTFYRVAFSIDDAARAEADDAYFNALVAPVLKEAINRYESAFGGSDTTRYGRYFCQLEDIRDGGEYVELRLIGNWASNVLLEKA